MFLKISQISQENTCVEVSYYEKQTPTQMNLRSFWEHLFWGTSPNECCWIYRGYYAVPWNDFKETYKWKNQFSRWQRVSPEATFWMVKKKEWPKIHFYWYFGLFPETIFIIKYLYALFTMLVKKPLQCSNFKTLWKLAESQQWNKTIWKKMRLLDRINDFEQFLSI